MIKLAKATVYKYKCIETEQSFDVEPNTTVLVGMNESGKTSILESLAKTNYFDKDDNFIFNLTHDYPRKQKKAIDKSGENPAAVRLEYQMDDPLAQEIERDLGVKLKKRSFTITKKYDNSQTWGLNWVPVSDFVSAKLKVLKITDRAVLDRLVGIRSASDIDAYIKELTADEAGFVEAIKSLKGYFENSRKWNAPIDEYIAMKYLSPNLPLFMYYDDYYMLPSRVSLNKIDSSEAKDSSKKTAKALLELADIDVTKVISSSSYEDFIAELEATQLIISDELFKYWSTNKNLKILFSIDKKEQTDNRNNRNVIDHILDIRVQNQRSGVSLPLGNRSKGFNWFFSFLVWFKKIQENKDKTYILLLDEPGLNLHAKAQSDLLKFLDDLSVNYQIIYTTHSPFMIDSTKLHQVRTVVEQEDGTHISDSVQEKDPNTLFPLQAALGYDIAQNLFVSSKNVIVEGIADLLYLNLLSGQLMELERVGLKGGATIIPVGGADKVATFISLLRGNDLNIVCLLDTFTDQSARTRLNNLVIQNIIKDKKIVFYHDILKTAFADVEDMFEVIDYLALYNGAFAKKITIDDIDATKPIMAQLKKKNGGRDFNHYLPASYYAKNVAAIKLSNKTLDNFEILFKTLNKLI
jgi:predicted ATP-dependent endonuclease of OLD family